MNRSKVFVMMMVCFAAGILSASHSAIPTVAVVICMVISVIGFVVGQAAMWAGLKIAMTCLMVFGLGVLRLQHYYQPNQFARGLNAKTQWDGVIVADVDVRTNKQQLTVQPYGYDQRILVVTDKKKHFNYGDRIVVTGKTTVPKPSEDFDYASYLHRFHTYALVSYPKIMTIRSGQGNGVTSLLLKAKYLFIKRINAVLSDTESSLLLGILIGARKSLPQSVIDDFNATGTSHIIAISGYNISIIISSLAFLAPRIGRKRNMWLTLLIVAAFVIMSGASSSVVRAAVMGSLFMVASRAGRMYAITPSLCLAAAVMLIVNPFILYWDASFQLSFLATAGIIFIVPPLETITKSWPSLFGLKSTLITTFAAIIATLPLILHSFGRLSLIAPVANILILPIVPATMLFGFLTATPVIGPGFGFVAHLLLSYILHATSFFAHLPHASAHMTVGSGAVILLYGVIIALCYGLHAWLQRRLRSATILETIDMLQ